jgi:hypothetical protein
MGLNRSGRRIRCPASGGRSSLQGFVRRRSLSPPTCTEIAGELAGLRLLPTQEPTFAPLCSIPVRRVRTTAKARRENLAWGAGGKGARER